MVESFLLRACFRACKIERKEEIVYSKFDFLGVLTKFQKTLILVYTHSSSSLRDPSGDSMGNFLPHRYHPRRFAGGIDQERGDQSKKKREMSW